MNKLKDFSELELEDELERRRKNKKAKWPRYLDIYVHGSKEDEEIDEWITENDNGWDTETKRGIANSAYEVKLTYSVTEDGDTELYAVDDRKLQGKYV